MIPRSRKSLEEGIATHSIILAWRTPWAEEPGGLQYTESDMTEQLILCRDILCIHTHIKNPSTFTGFPGGSEVKNPPANAGGMHSIPGSGRSLEEKMATHSRILAWEILWTEEPGGLQSMGLQIVRHDSATKQQLEV